MTDSLYRLQYSSVLCGETKEAETTLAVIIAKALKNNPAFNITGILYYCRETKKLCQVLEGPKATVISLYDRIADDPRHHSWRVLDERPISDRQFADFGMALTRTTNPEQRLLETGGSAHDEHLVRIQYSSALVAPDAREGRAVVQDILRVAVRNNVERRIGGVLCFNPATMGITQVLEGPAAAVRSLFTTILADERHVGCTLTSEELLLDGSELLFGSSWGMLQSETQDDNLLGLSSLIQQSYEALLRAAPSRPAGRGVDVDATLIKRALDDVMYVDVTPSTAELQFSVGSLTLTDEALVSGHGQAQGQKRGR